MIQKQCHVENGMIGQFWGGFLSLANLKISSGTLASSMQSRSMMMRTKSKIIQIGEILVQMVAWHN